jgi:peptidoglycan-N-acetylglucosamine deacetylase
MRSIRFVAAGVTVLIFAAAALLVAAGRSAPLSDLLGPAYWCGPPTRRVVALTFDDGPDPRWTTPILSILHKDRVHATFFVEGENVIAHPQLLLAERRAGDEIGNHTWDHHDLTWLGPETIGSEIDRTQRAILKVTGHRAWLFRPPYGRRSVFLWPEARSRGLKTVEWNLSPWHGPHPCAEDLVRRTMKYCRPGSIILLHDGRGNRKAIVDALPAIISDLRAHGYRFVTVSQLESLRQA